MTETHALSVCYIIYEPSKVYVLNYVTTNGISKSLEVIPEECEQLSSNSYSLTIVLENN